MAKAVIAHTIAGQNTCGKRNNRAFLGTSPWQIPSDITGTSTLWVEPFGDGVKT
jgi:hypothetical protein